MMDFNILWILSGIVLMGGITFFVVGRKSEMEPDLSKLDGGNDDGVSPEVFEYQRKAILEVHQNLGKTVDEIFANETDGNWREILDALHLFASWKHINDAPLTDTERMIFAYFAIRMEVPNGGFHQYFFNSSGDSWEDLRNLLERAGDSDGLSRFQTVLAVFPDGKPSKVRKERWKQLDKHGEEQYELFEEMDHDYFASPFPDAGKAYAFIKASKDDLKPLSLDRTTRE